jgi:hypothetical protein
MVYLKRKRNTMRFGVTCCVFYTLKLKKKRVENANHAHMKKLKNQETEINL